MDKVLDMISKWDHVGQGFFFLLCLGIVAATIKGIVDGIVILARGYKPPKSGN